MNSSEYQKAKQAAFRLIKARARSEQELKNRLKEKKFSSETIEETLTSLKKTHLIDDRQFAQDWISSRLAKPFGLKRILFELKNKGISQELAVEVFSSLEENYDEEKVVKDLVERRLARYKNLNDDGVKKRLFDFLAQRGFKLETIQEVLEKT